MYYILLLLLYATPAYGTTTDPVTKQLDIPSQCQFIDEELVYAVKDSIITQQQSVYISIRCWDKFPKGW